MVIQVVIARALFLFRPSSGFLPVFQAFLTVNAFWENAMAALTID
jgi:hypothetical protein